MIMTQALRSAKTGLARVQRIGRDASVDEADMALGVGGDIFIMGDKHDGDAALFIELAEQFHQITASRRIEIAGRLVGEDDGGIGDQGAGDGDALLLAAGQFGRGVGLAVGKSHRGKRFAGSL